MRAFPWPDAPPVESIARALPPDGRFWLDGVVDHPEGRWAFLGAEPSEVRARRFGEPDPFEVLRALPAAGAAEGLPVAAPEWVGWIAYDAAWSQPGAIGLRAPRRHTRAELPVVWLGRYPAVIAVDTEAGETFVIAEDGATAARWRARLGAGSAPPRARVGPVVAEEPALHRARIEAALEAIAAGEIYQVNLARPYEASFEGDALALFEAMREASPVPLGAFLETGGGPGVGGALVARTMERFLRLDRASGRLWTSPIKGTIARTGRDDPGEAARLAADAKERAEHSMIVDLMRNDLSRVGRVGSVRVREALRVEPFAGLSHLVSTVECEVPTEIELPALLAATFPPGSVTGTPKLRAMELIEALEGRARGAYTGAVGYVDGSGGLSLAVAIRTAVIEGGRARYFAGGGLVEASDAEREIAETELKARVFLDAARTLSRENTN